VIEGRHRVLAIREMGVMLFEEGRFIG